ncbi:hypothetical protein OUZ56_026996 [Daphnia magna]|uniref:Uncharacterized protein n=1 Tax=Daphnia magna TaxID=35525 RepID=A0ABQ9ZNG2_9CRUS|nr:hypothetical protein OUZ56_026996 [Daphnia magna]
MKTSVRSNEGRTRLSQTISVVSIRVLEYFHFPPLSRCGASNPVGYQSGYLVGERIPITSNQLFHLSLINDLAN